MKRKFVPVLVLLSLILATLACGGSAPSDDEVEATSPPPVAEATEESAEPTSPPAESELEIEPTSPPVDSEVET